MDTNAKITRKNNMLLAFISVITVLVLIAVAGWLFLKPQSAIIQGQVEASEVRVSGKVPGRILELRVKEGDIVRKGDTLAIIDSPEVLAKLEQAQAAEDAAQAQNAKALKGAREEQIATAYALRQKAIAGLDIAEKSYKRIQNLYNQGVVSAQKRDEAEANFQAMKATEQAATAQYQMAVNGAEIEDKSAAQALVNKAKGAVDEVTSYIRETYLLAPIDGEIAEIFPKTGELIGTGAPVMNVLDKQDSWVVFNVREDYLKTMTVGKTINAYVPALDMKIKLKVYYLKDQGSYASWKATKVSGQYDLKTFEVKARPETYSEELYPGMSVIIDNF
ncbi:MAG: HlyD family efflux transporter periplasmic adaptor subunit [Candidatus Symbiothrix sp.]|jgi:HlyD family secretion protein|nr:HlyD family efflux transporter periplasmic adaptor subunit [Candidatus Symbiothrix sp.]